MAVLAQLYGEIYPEIVTASGKIVAEITSLLGGKSVSFGYGCCPDYCQLGASCSCKPIIANMYPNQSAYIEVKELSPYWKFLFFTISDVSLYTRILYPCHTVWNCDGTVPFCDAATHVKDTLSPCLYSVYNPTMVTMDREGYLIRGWIDNQTLKTTIYPYNWKCNLPLPIVGNVSTYECGRMHMDSLYPWLDATPAEGWDFECWIQDGAVDMTPNASGFPKGLLPYIQLSLKGQWSSDPFYRGWNSDVTAVFVPKIWGYPLMQDDGRTLVGTMTVTPAGTPRPVYDLSFDLPNRRARIDMDGNYLFKGETIVQTLTLVNASQGKVYLGNVVPSGLPSGLSFSFSLASTKFLASGASVNATAILKVAPTAPFPRNETITWYATMSALPATNWDLTKKLKLDGTPASPLVDMSDAIVLSNSFNKRAGQAGYNRLADINRDGVVDIFDNILLANHWGESVI